MKYEVDIKKIESTESYEKEKTNVMQVYAQKKHENNEITKCSVQFLLSKNAMLGLGKELIRYAYLETRVDHHFHLDPIVPGQPRVQALGVLLEPHSIAGIIGHGEFGSIVSILQESDKNHE